MTTPNGARSRPPRINQAKPPRDVVDGYRQARPMETTFAVGEGKSRVGRGRYHRGQNCRHGCHTPNAFVGFNE